MTLIIWLLALSVMAQFATCALAFRLNWVHGWKWAWMFISLGVAVMTVRRCLVLYHALTGESITVQELADDGGALHLATAFSTLMASLFLLAGVVLIEHLFAQAALAEQWLSHENERLSFDVRLANAQLETARDIQRQLYPVNPPRIAGYDVAGRSIPATAAGGDYFDFLPLTRNVWGICVGDVSGHGLGSALVMAQVHAYVRAIVRTTNDPGEILTRVNSLLTTPSLSGRFVTLFFARLDTETNRLSYASAAHPGYLLGAKGQTLKLEIASPPLGVIKHPAIATVEHLPLQVHDVLFVPTDGVTEALSPGEELFGVDRTLQVIKAHRSHSALQIVEALEASLQAFTKTGRQQDDVTSVIVKRLETADLG